MQTCSSKETNVVNNRTNNATAYGHIPTYSEKPQPYHHSIHLFV